MKKVELLAPAGNYQAFIGAMNAGADAVYLGGDKFSARAYADNFSEEEICRALRYAHIFGKKIYLTVNTLVKEKEFSLLEGMIRPLYEEGLDGIIVQDFGVWRYVKEVFPGMELHASTQMMITGSMGAAFLKEEGASRIVPARELSLEEIRKIKKQTGLELECFIHGAMCYSYSGGCLFSSILGGRSGNRGRCAQPCRLPYQIADEDGQKNIGDGYPLSLKDLCTIDEIPKLIEAGIDSFKIEGRMKKPVYAAGVTAIYRKYIDLYYEKGAESYYVEEADMDRLRGLYIRSEVQNGYYERANGREMITLHQPGYAGSDENLIREIEARYLQEERKQPIAMKGRFYAGEPALLHIEGRIDGKKLSQDFYGEQVQQAQKRPMTKADFLKQLRKIGNSHVRIVLEDIAVGEGVFMPVGQLNELRRNAVEAFENRMMEAQINYPKRRMDKLPENMTRSSEKTTELFDKMAEITGKAPKLHVLVQNQEQLQTVCQYHCDRIYIDSDFYMQHTDSVSQSLARAQEPFVYLALPHIVREKDSAYLEALYAKLSERIRGFLVRNLESAFWVLSLRGKPEPYDMVTDAGVYCLNREAALFWHSYANECYLPWELNGKEGRYLARGSGQPFSMVVYGTIPMMLTANCLKKTAGTCLRQKKEGPVYLIDRYQTKFPTLCNCEHCYNVIYNSVPYSLHQKKAEIWKSGLSAVRLDFLWETKRQIEAILDFYIGKKEQFPIADYTTGHYKRGIE